MADGQTGARCDTCPALGRRRQEAVWYASVPFHKTMVAELLSGGERTQYFCVGEYMPPLTP